VDRAVLTLEVGTSVGRICESASPIANRQISRAEAALNGPVADRPTHVLHGSRDGSERFGSGRAAARKHTAKFEPAAWSWRLELGPNDERFRSPKQSAF
jgi:hypothetical protein